MPRRPDSLTEPQQACPHLIEIGNDVELAIEDINNAIGSDSLDDIKKFLQDALTHLEYDIESNIESVREICVALREQRSYYEECVEEIQEVLS